MKGLRIGEETSQQKYLFFFISFFFLFIYFTYVRTISEWHNITKTACSFYHLKDSDGKLF